MHYATNTGSLFSAQLIALSHAFFLILGSIMTVGIALLVFSWGMKKIAGTTKSSGIAPMRDMQFGETYTSQTSYLNGGGTSGSDPKFL